MSTLRRRRYIFYFTHGFANAVKIFCGEYFGFIIPCYYLKLQIKQTRITRLFKEVFLIQMSIFAVMFMMFPLDFKDEKSGEQTSYFKRVMITVIASVFSLQGLSCAFVLYFALHMFAVVVTSKC